MEETLSTLDDLVRAGKVLAIGVSNTPAWWVARAVMLALTHRGGSAEVQGAARSAAERLAIPASAITDAIAFAVGRPATVDVDELLVRPTAQL